ncbi:MAG TPA: PDC sensor domain-containing protein [Thermoanaerobaculia bacterium]|nr:PDC sensor domain-containing protein [Thermoanaerobaculia bacterium]
MHTAAVLAVFLPLAAAQPAGTENLDAVIAAEVKQIRTWAQDATLVDAVSKQNALKIPLARIRSIDISWQTETANNPRMQALLKNPCAKRLQALTASRPGYREAFVMESQGALVCITRKTSDYWQGDEAKWQKSFAEGRGELFIAEPELDESTGVKLIHISVPIMEAGKAIGVLTLGIEHDLLVQRAKKP